MAARCLLFMPNIKLFLPQSAEDVHNCAEDIILFATEANGGEPPEGDFIDWLAQYPHTLYLFYDDDKPLGFIRLDDRGLDPYLGKNTVEIHGAILPEYRGYADAPALFVMREAFKKKKNIIAKIDPNNLGAKGFCLKWGFRKINREFGKDVYRLKRSEFMRKHA